MRFYCVFDDRIGMVHLLLTSHSGPCDGNVVLRIEDNVLFAPLCGSVIIRSRSVFRFCFEVLHYFLTLY